MDHKDVRVMVAVPYKRRPYNLSCMNDFFIEGKMLYNNFASPDSQYEEIFNCHRVEYHSLF